MHEIEDFENYLKNFCNKNWDNRKVAHYLAENFVKCCICLNLPKQQASFIISDYYDEMLNLLKEKQEGLKKTKIYSFDNSCFTNPLYSQKKP